MKQLLDKFYAGTATPEEEAWLLRSADSLPEGADRELLQGLAAMQRQAAISQLIDNVAVETGHAPSRHRRRTRWPYWIGALAMAACILLMLMPREAMPVQVAESNEAPELRRPRLSTDNGHPARPTLKRESLPVAGAGKMPAIPGQAGSLTSQPIPLDIIEEDVEDITVFYEPSNELLYAEAEPLMPSKEADEEIITLTAPSLIARANSSTLIAHATPADPSTLQPQPSTLNFHLIIGGQTLGDPDADPFGGASLFGN